MNMLYQNRKTPQRSGWVIIEALTATIVFSVAITASIAGVNALQRHAEIQQKQQLVLLEAESIAEWISVQSNERLVQESDVIELPTFFPSTQLARHCEGVQIRVVRIQEDAALSVDRFDIEITYQAVVGQSAKHHLSSWRTWP